MSRDISQSRDGTVSWVLIDYLGPHHPPSPVIRMGFRQSKEKKKSLCAVAYARMHERICIFCGECGVHFNRWCAHHACAGVYIKQVL